MTTLAPLLEAFFTERLIGQRHASRHTVAAYRDAFCLLLRFAQHRTGRSPHQLALEDLDAGLIGAFLNHLEVERGASVRTRNARLTAIRSLFNFAAYRHPEHAALIQRVLAIPPKRTTKVLVTYLTDDEAAALLDAPDRSSWIGRRDHALLLLAVETGLRVSELTGLTCGAVQLGTGAHVRCTGKGRICCIRHILPYVAPRTMSRPRRGTLAPGGDRAGLFDICRSYVRPSRKASRASGGR
jgi:site-specific recombinase XerD